MAQEKKYKYSSFTSSLSQTPIQSDFFGRDRLPNRPKQNSPYYLWKDVYLTHLENMYNIIENHIGEIEDENGFENFCKLVYSKSSKYITPNI